MIDIIAKEDQEDQAQKDWCDSERAESHTYISDKDTEKGTLEGTIVDLEDDISNEETGLKKQLEDENTRLAQNRKNQADETEDRGLETVAYQKNVNNLVDAQKAIKQATEVLKKFYDWLHQKQGPHHYEE